MSRKNSRSERLGQSLVEQRFSRRASRRAKRRESGKIKKVALGILIGLGMAGAIVGYQQVQPVLADWMGVQHVSISGLQQLSREHVVSRLGLSPGQTLLSVDKQNIQQQLQADPWIESATIGRVLPDTLTITVKERRPAAIYWDGHTRALLGKQGMVLSNKVDPHDHDLPTLKGLNLTLLLNEDLQSKRQVTLGIELAEKLFQQFGARPLVNIKNLNHIMAEVQGLRFQFGASWEQQWKRYQILEPTIEAKVKSGRREIDLRFPGKVIVRQRG